MGTATSIAAITMAMKDLPIGIMIIIADFGTALGTSTASVRAGDGLTTTTSMSGFVARTTNCVVVCPARAWRMSLALCRCQSERPSTYFGIALKADANSTWGCIALNSRVVQHFRTKCSAVKKVLFDHAVGECKQSG